jgi:large subunit ribosomal protein L16
MNKFIPKNYKYKKLRKRIRANLLTDYRCSDLKFSNFGLKIMKNTIISSVVLEAARRSITRKLKRTGKLRINGFPFVPLTKKSLGVRMGKGVGNIASWVFPVKKGRILFELKNVSFEQAKSAFRSASFKLPIKTKFIYKIKK